MNPIRHLTGVAMLVLLLTAFVSACPDYKTSRHEGCRGQSCPECKQKGLVPPQQPQPTKLKKTPKVKITPAPRRAKDAKLSQ